MPLLLSFVCRAELSTRHFIVALQQDAGSPNQSFSIKTYRRVLVGAPSDIDDIYGYSGSDFLFYDKRQKPDGYSVKTPLVESISWQWLYATNLLVAYELILTTKEPPLGPFSWLPVETVFAVGWLLKSYGNLDLPLFNPIQQPEATSMLTQGGQPIAITTMMPGSGHDQQQGQQPESSCEQASQATSLPTGSFTSPLYSGSDDGDGDFQEHSHTLCLNCFVHPCHGVCRFRTSSDNTHSPGTEAAYTDSKESLNNKAPMPGNSSLSTNDLVIVNGLLKLRSRRLLKGAVTSCPLDHFPPPMVTPETQHTTIVSSRLGGTPSYLSRSGKVPATGSDGQRACDVTVVGQNGQQQPCGKICNNIQALSNHKIRNHSGQQTCDVILIEEDHQQQPCGVICKNIRALSAHKSNYHSGPRTCNVAIVGEDSQQKPCGMVCKNSHVLSEHKRKAHSGQKICDIISVGKDGRQQSCGKRCNSSKSLSHHKSRYHTGQHTCQETLITEDGQQRPCGKVCMHAQALADHKRRHHTGQKTCEVEVTAMNGELRPCGKVFKGAQGLSEHIRRHRKRKPVDLDQNDDLSPSKGKVNK
ncbi:hypothetical protein [Endozoicomonas sp. 8E]|uniref:hypothetical protein n=1 Tax=Endozoicomonas sp. 8E TaxID=3035692 RepID=UPI002938ED10|nr:hypothetical protein [Endozoicomonas sp. 8E]WOG26993.1 hypothetical protein P6910_20945 [Endozoicomonas sp. 8E]